jgi:hypothetical protein
MRTFSACAQVVTLVFAAAAVACGSSNDTVTNATGGAAGASGAAGVAGPAGIGGAQGGGPNAGGAPGAGGSAGDASAVDLCATTTLAAAPKKLCNGPIPGPGAASASGGLCGSNDCNPSLVCLKVSTTGLEGLCLPTCMPADTEFSTGTCASGYRCVTMSSTEGYCFPSCNNNADCASGICQTTTGVCYPPLGTSDSGAGGGPGDGATPDGSGGTGGAVEGGADVVVTDVVVTDVVADTKQDVVLQNPVLLNPVLLNPVLQNPVLQNPVLQNPVLQNPVLQNPVLQNPVLQNPVLQNPVIRLL